jgi:hypothetical protein
MNGFSSTRKIGVFLYTVLLFSVSSAFGLTVSSLEELVAAAADSNQDITMTPGVYQMEDYLTPAVISAIEADEYGRKAMITFGGSNNTFNFTNVTIEVNTELLNDLGGNVMEFEVIGSSNVIAGLTVTDIGMEPTASGGQSFTVMGDYVTIKDVTLNMSGSYPYGYGDLLGKGSGNLVSLKKHSGMLISGLNVSVIGCEIYSKSFGHLFFVQGGRNVLFQDCIAEAVTRTTDDMLAETSGPAYDLDFACVYNNYDGVKVISPGYTKSLSECGFRTYGTGANGYATGVVIATNCVARNCRIGFAFTKVEEEMLIQDCEATGCESAYNITGVTIENSRGDAVNGPLLYINTGDISTVDLSLMSAAPTTTVHAVACIPGTDHVVTLRKWEGTTRDAVHSILVGSTRSAGSNPFSPLGTATTTGITLNNYTEMPVVIGSTASSCTITSNGEVTDNGSNNTITYVREVDPVGWWCFDDLSGTVAADSSGAGYDGTVENAAWSVGVSGGALEFDGTSSRVVLPATAFDSISNEVSIAMWIYGADEQPLEDSCFYAAGAAGERILNIHLPYGNTNVYWDAGNTNGYDRLNKLADESAFKGVWNHWVFTKNATAGTMEIYLNGTLWKGASGKTMEISGITEACIGAQLNARYYSGLMDEVRLYDVALTAEEIGALYQDAPVASALALEGAYAAVVDGRAGSTNDMKVAFAVPQSGYGYNFQVQYTENLAEPFWEDASEVVAGTGEELSVEVLMDPTKTNGFYRMEAWRK